MKRLLLAGAIAVAVHALFLSGGSGWFSGSAYVPPKKPPITLSLNMARQPAGKPVQDERMAVKAIRGPAVPEKRTEPKPSLKPKPQPKPKPQSKPKPRQKAKPHQEKKPRPQPAAQPEPALLKAKAKAVLPSRTSVPGENQEERKTEQALSVTPVPKKETSKPASGGGFNDVVSDEMVQEALAEYPDQGVGVPKQGQPAGAPEPRQSGPATQMAIPLYLKNPRPKYPEVARRRRFQGTVILAVLVKKDGRASDVRIFRSSGHLSLDRAALTAVRKWVFKPGSENGRAVDMRVRIPIRFQLD